MANFRDRNSFTTVTNSDTVIQSPTNAPVTVCKLLTKFKNKNRKLSTDNFFLVDIKVNGDDGKTEGIGEYSLYADKFNFQLFKMESEIYKRGFQNISFIKDINIADTFKISLKENPNHTISKLIYDYMFSLIKNNASRIITEYDTLFDEVYVYHFLDTINKEKGNHFVYKFKNCKLFNISDDNDASLDFTGVGLVDKPLTLKFNEVEIIYYDMDLDTDKKDRKTSWTTYSINLVNNTFNSSTIVNKSETETKSIEAEMKKRDNEIAKKQADLEALNRKIAEEEKRKTDAYNYKNESELIAIQNAKLNR